MQAVLIMDTFTVAYRRWEIRGRPDGPEDAIVADWLGAERLRHQMIEEAAYFNWINRNRIIGDPLTDWVAAEAQIADRTAQGQLSDTIIDECLRRQVIEEKAYFRWIHRGLQFGDPWQDWYPAEAELVMVAENRLWY